MRGLSSQQKAIIKEVAIIGGIVTLAIVAPNVVKLFGRKSSSNQRRSQSFKRCLSSLETRGLIRHKDGIVSLTNEGKHVARAAIRRSGGVEGNGHWDKKWRVVFFDIPEDKKKHRDSFRLLLREYGFVQIQKSAYVSPFNCLADIREIAREYGLVRYISLVEAETIETDRNLHAIFKL